MSLVTTDYNSLSLLADSSDPTTPLSSLNQDGGTLIQNNFKYIADSLITFLKINNNLSDLANPATALSNLGGLAINGDGSSLIGNAISLTVGSATSAGTGGILYYNGGQQLTDNSNRILVYNSGDTIIDHDGTIYVQGDSAVPFATDGFGNASLGGLTLTITPSVTINQNLIVTGTGSFSSNEWNVYAGGSTVQSGGAEFNGAVSLNGNNLDMVSGFILNCLEIGNNFGGAMYLGSAVNMNSFELRMNDGSGSGGNHFVMDGGIILNCGGLGVIGALSDGTYTCGVTGSITITNGVITAIS